MSGKKKIASILTTAVILIAGGAIMFLLSAKKAESEKKEESEIIREVNTQPLYPEDVETWVEGGGFLKSGRTLAITAGVGGRIKYSKGELKGGEKVNQGDLLLSLDSRTAENLFHKSRLELLRLSSTFFPLIQQTSGNTDRWREYIDLLADEENRKIPRPPTEEGRETLLAASQGILSAWYTLDEAVWNLEQHRITAPFSGSLTGEGITAGSLISPGTILARLVDTDHFEAVITLPSGQLNSVVTGAEVSVVTETRTIPAGRVSGIEPVLQSGTARIHVDLNNGEEIPLLLPGAYVNLRIKGETLRGVYRVPRHLIHNGRVPVLKEGKLHFQEMEILTFLGDEAILKSEFEGGAKLITTILQMPIEGMPLKEEERNAPDA